MKKRLLFLSVLALFLSNAVNAYDFSAKNDDGKLIYYYITSPSQRTCAVTYFDDSSSNNYAYSGTIDIPSTVNYDNTTYTITSIDLKAFYLCSNLTSVTIPESVTSIGSSAFMSCTGLKSITIPESVTEIGDLSFYYCRGLTQIVIPSNVTSIETATFQGCTGLTQVTIGNNVTSIGQMAFYGCSGLTEVNIPDNVTSIGSSAFSNCTRLNEVTIGNGVTRIGTYAFYYCRALNSITSLNPEPPTCSSSTFDGVSKSDCVLYVPEGKTMNYASASVWEDFYKILEIGATPTVQTFEVTEVTESSAILRGQVTAGTENVLEQGFEYWTEGEDVQIAIANEDMSVIITDLEEGAEYSYRAFATTSSVKTYGETMTFTTLNLSLLNSLLEEIDEVVAIFNDAWTTITTDYSDMTDELQANYDAISAEIASVETELNEAYEAGELNGEIVDELQEQLAAIEQEIEDMLNYASQYTAIADITANGNVEAVGYYTLDGKQVPTPQRGVNIIRYSDGSAKKVLVK